MSFICLVAFVVVPATTRGEEEFLNNIPNSENTNLTRGRPCAICHVRPQGDGDRNDFGFDYENAPGTFAWPEIYMLDSDGDGQTNGLEMGDPDGVWRPGDTPSRTEDLSFPGNPRSLSFQPAPDLGPGFYADADADVDGASDSEASDARDAGVSSSDAGPPPESSGCRCATPGTFGASYVVVLGLGGILVRARHRLRRDGRA